MFNVPLSRLHRRTNCKRSSWRYQVPPRNAVHNKTWAQVGAQSLRFWGDRDSHMVHAVGSGNWCSNPLERSAYVGYGRGFNVLLIRCIQQKINFTTCVTRVQHLGNVPLKQFRFSSQKKNSWSTRFFEWSNLPLVWLGFRTVTFGSSDCRSCHWQLVGVGELLVRRVLESADSSGSLKGSVPWSDDTHSRLVGEL